MFKSRYNIRAILVISKLPAYRFAIYEVFFHNYVLTQNQHTILYDYNYFCTHAFKAPLYIPTDLGAAIENYTLHFANNGGIFTDNLQNLTIYIYGS